MNEVINFFSNRYVRYMILSLFVGVLLYLLLTIIDLLVKELDLPNGLRLMLSALASGYVVYRYLLPKIW